MITGKAMYEGPHSGVEAWIETMDGEIEDLQTKFGQIKTYKCLGKRETKLKQVRAYGRNGEVSMQKRLELGRAFVAVEDDSVDGWSPVKRLEFDDDAWNVEQQAPAWVDLPNNGNLMGTPQQESMFAMPVTGMHMVANPAYIDDDTWNEQRRVITRFYKARIPMQHRHLIALVKEGDVDGMKTALLGVARNDPKKHAKAVRTKIIMKNSTMIKLSNYNSFIHSWLQLMRDDFGIMKSIKCCHAGTIGEDCGHKMDQEEFVKGCMTTIRIFTPSMAIDFDAAFRQGNPWKLAQFEAYITRYTEDGKLVVERGAAERVKQPAPKATTKQTSSLQDEEEAKYAVGGNIYQTQQAKFQERYGEYDDGSGQRYDLDAHHDGQQVYEDGMPRTDSQDQWQQWECKAPDGVQTKMQELKEQLKEAQVKAFGGGYREQYRGQEGGGKGYNQWGKGGKGDNQWGKGDKGGKGKGFAWNDDPNIPPGIEYMNVPHHCTNCVKLNQSERTIESHNRDTCNKPGGQMQGCTPWECNKTMKEKDWYTKLKILKDIAEEAKQSPTVKEEKQDDGNQKMSANTYDSPNLKRSQVKHAQTGSPMQASPRHQEGAGGYGDGSPMRQSPTKTSPSRAREGLIAQEEAERKRRIIEDAKTQWEEEEAEKQAQLRWDKEGTYDGTARPFKVVIENDMDQHIEAHLRNVTDGHEPEMSTRKFQEASSIATAAAVLTIKHLFEADDATKRLNKESMLAELQAHLEDATKRWTTCSGNGIVGVKAAMKYKELCAEIDHYTHLVKEVQHYAKVQKTIGSMDADTQSEEEIEVERGLEEIDEKYAQIEQDLEIAHGFASVDNGDDPSRRLARTDENAFTWALGNPDDMEMQQYQRLAGGNDTTMQEAPNEEHEEESTDIREYARAKIRKAKDCRKQGLSKEDREAILKRRKAITTVEMARVHQQTKEIVPHQQREDTERTKWDMIGYDMSALWAKVYRNVAIEDDHRLKCRRQLDSGCCGLNMLKDILFFIYGTADGSCIKVSTAVEGQMGTAARYGIAVGSLPTIDNVNDRRVQHRRAFQLGLSILDSTYHELINENRFDIEADGNPSPHRVDKKNMCIFMYEHDETRRCIVPLTWQRDAIYLDFRPLTENEGIEYVRNHPMKDSDWTLGANINEKALQVRHKNEQIVEDVEALPFVDEKVDPYHDEKVRDLEIAHDIPEHMSVPHHCNVRDSSKMHIGDRLEQYELEQTLANSSPNPQCW